MTVSGGEGNDTIWTGSGDDCVGGDDGEDGIHTGRGSDWISGGDGADTILAGPNDDVVFGFYPVEKYWLLLDYYQDEDFINGGPGSDLIEGGPCGDRILAGAETYPSGSVDRVYGYVSSAPAYTAGEVRISSSEAKAMTS